MSEVFNIKSIMLGSSRLNSVESAIYSGFCLTFLVWMWWDFAIAKKFDLRKERINGLFFLFVNFTSLWVISKFSGFTGLYIDSYLWIFMLSVLTTTIQRMVWKVIVGR